MKKRLSFKKLLKNLLIFQIFSPSHKSCVYEYIQYKITISVVMKFNIILLIMKSIIFCVTKETIAGSVKAKNHWFTAIFISQIKK